MSNGRGQTSSSGTVEADLVNALQNRGISVREVPENVANIQNEQLNSSNVSSHSNDDFDILGRLNGAETADDTGINVDISEELRELLKDSEKSVEYAAPLPSLVADRFLNTIKRPLSKDNAAKIKEGLKFPENCKIFVPPRMNSEIWKCIPSYAKMDDLKKQQQQHAISSGLVGLASIAAIITQHYSALPKSVSNTIIKIAQDTGDILGDQFQSFSQKRRLDVRKFVSQECAGICTQDVKPEELLFGNNLNEALSSAKTTAAVMKVASAKNVRPHPYNNFNHGRRGFTPSSSPGNFNRFPAPLRRGGWNQQQGRPWNRSQFSPRTPQQFRKYP